MPTMMKSAIFIDLDGTLVRHQIFPYDTPDALLPGTVDKLNSWQAQGYKLILTTNRKASECIQILSYLMSQGIAFDHSLFDLGAGPRYLINDRKEPTEDKAIAINLARDTGISNIHL